MPHHELIRLFSEIRSGDTALVGGKGASLGEMAAAGFPVPPGFVVTTAAFDRFLDETDLAVEVHAELDRLNIEDMKGVEETARVIRSLFTGAATPSDIGQAILGSYEQLGRAMLVAVRSSATAEDSAAASWAGELETYLNTGKSELLSKVKECWASLYSPRALVYAVDRGFLNNKKNTKKGAKQQPAVAAVKVAVVIQAMVQSEVAGVAFTVHPVTKDPNQMIIEAVWGLGEALVSGQVTPDSYVVGKSGRTLIDTHFTEQERQLSRGAPGSTDPNVWAKVATARRTAAKLNTKQIFELAEICINIEKHYGAPCDIEWAFAKGKFYITQSRPITTL